MSTRLLRPNRSGRHIFPGMDRNTAIDRLPAAYAAALRLQDDGHDDNAIAARLDLAPAAIGPLLRVATAKLHTILAAEKRACDLSPGDAASIEGCDASR